MDTCCLYIVSALMVKDMMRCLHDVLVRKIANYLTKKYVCFINFKKTLLLIADDNIPNVNILII